MARKIKVVFILLLLVFLTAAMTGYQVVKEGSIRELYEDVTFMRIATEARQYISQIEYGIKNGRQLDNFFNMQETLKGVQGCSSYMEGAYVVSAGAKLLYQRGIEADSLNLDLPPDGQDLGGELFTVREEGPYFYLTSPIQKAGGGIEGYLIMCIGQNAVNNAVSEYNHQNKIQSLLIAVEIFGAALLMIARVKPERKNLALRLMLVLSLAVTTAAVVDAAMVCTRFYQIVDDATTQTANKMAQALQSQVDSVVEKGVPAARIYDLNGWLAQNSSEMDIVTSFNLERNNKITANVDQEYIKGFLYRLLVRSALFVFVTLLGGLVACGSLLLLGRRTTGWKFYAREKGIEYGL